MLNFKEIFKQKKNIVLGTIAIILILVTCYQLKLIGLASSEDAKVVATNTTTAKSEKQNEVTNNEKNDNKVSEKDKLTNTNTSSNSSNTENTVLSNNTKQNNIVDEKNDKLSKNEVSNTTSENVTNSVSNTVKDPEKANTNTTASSKETNNTVSNKAANNTVVNNSNAVSNTVSNSANTTNTVTNASNENLVVDESKKEAKTEETEKIEDSKKSEDISEKFVEAKVLDNVDSIGKTEKIKEIKELVYEDEELIAKVTEIDEGSIPTDAVLTVKKLNIKEEAEKIDKIYEELSKKAEEDKKLLAGFIAYDISFKDKFGNEIEPYGNVNVTLDYKQIQEVDIPNVDKTDISINHLEENEAGKIVNTVDLEKENQLKNIETTSAKEVKAVEFETKSFSTFTITYRYSGRTGSVITVHYVDEQGKELNGIDYRDDDCNSEITFADYSDDLRVNGYTYLGAHYGTSNGSLITRMTAQNSLDSGSINTARVVHETIFYNGNQIVARLERENTAGSSIRRIDVYLVFAKTGDLKIVDTISKDGCLIATVDGVEQTPTENVKYVWYKTKNNPVSGNTVNYNAFTEVNRAKITSLKQTDNTYKDIYNIPDEDGGRINIAYDKASDGPDYYYYVKRIVTAADGTVTETNSDVYQVPYYDELKNGGFETPVNPASTFEVKYPSGKRGIIWKTTGFGAGTGSGRENQDIEIIRWNGVNDRPGVYKWFGIRATAEGAQCAEINAHTEGALYQDILTVPGSQLSWQLCHRARIGGGSSSENVEDTMYIVAIPTAIAEKYDLTTSTKVRNAMNSNNPDFANIEVVTIKTRNGVGGTATYRNGNIVNSTTIPKTGYNVYGGSTTDWYQYSGTFSIRDNQYLTRYFFVAAEKSGNDTSGGPGDISVGNLVDNIVVSDKLPAPNAGQANLLLKKVVKGLDEFPSGYNVNLTVNITNYYNNAQRDRALTSDFDIYTPVYDQNHQITTDREATWVIPIYITPSIGHESIKTLTENTGFDVNGYTYETTYEINKINSDDSKTLLKSGPISELGTLVDINQRINEKDNIEISIINNYTKNSQDFDFTKLDEDGSALPGAKFRLTSSDQSVEPIEATSGTDGKVSFTNISFGTYTLKEIEVPNSNYVLPTTEYTVTVSKDGVKVLDGSTEKDISNFTITNHLKRTSIKINKTSPLGNVITGVTFGIYENGTEIATITNSDATPKFVFSNLKYNTEYIIKEISTPSSYYKMSSDISITITEQNGITINNSADSEIMKLVSVSDSKDELNIINLKHATMPKAGGMGTTMFYIFGILLMGISGYIYIKTNKTKF